MGEPDNILLIRLKCIGDIVFTLPAVHQVREAFPRARISYLVSREYAPLLEGFRDVDAVIALDRARLRAGNPAAIAREVFCLLRQVRRRRFSLAVDFQGYGETALLTWWSGAPQRWGTVYGRGRQWAYTRGIPRDSSSHPAQNFLSMLRACGLRSFPIRNQFLLPDKPLEEARRLFVGWGLDLASPTLFIQPFTSSPQKDWPLERYLEVAGACRRRGVQVIFGGGPADRAALEPARQAGFPVSAGASLLVTAGLMKLSTLILGGNTGMLPLAVAMAKRVVMIMDSIGPGSAHALEHRDWAVVPPEGQAMAALSTDAVNAACSRALAELGVPVTA
jgi:ADP-heptose:LPS heptosyltransferase